MASVQRLKFSVFIALTFISAVSLAAPTVELDTSTALKELAEAFPEPETFGNGCKIAVFALESTRGGIEITVTGRSKARASVSVIPGLNRVFKTVEATSASSEVRYSIVDEDNNNQAAIEIRTVEDVADFTVVLSPAQGDSASCRVEE